MNSTVMYYRYCMEQSDYCESMALVTSDIDMKLFWHNASLAFKERVLEMQII